MSKLKSDFQTGKAIAARPTTAEEKTNMKKARIIDENANIALVNLRRSIETKKADRLQKNLHLIDFDKPSQSV